jgi:hypothetical protein
MFQLQSYKSLAHFKNVPPIINLSKIHIITDTNYLLDLENKYDSFLEKNVELLDLYNIIDELIDIRNTITLQISRIRRKKQIYNYYYNNENKENNNNINENNNNKNKNKNNNNLKKNDYTLTQNSLKEYKCGCKNTTYQNINYQKQKQKNIKLNRIPVIQKQQYCDKHLNMLETKYILEEELTKIKTELANIKNKENEVIKT